MVIGVLDIQGSAEEHFDMLRRLRVEAKLVKNDFSGIDRLVLPGGESTTISTLLKLYGLDKKLRLLPNGVGLFLGRVRERFCWPARFLAVMFHPEMAEDTTIYSYFVRMCR